MESEAVNMSSQNSAAKSRAELEKFCIPANRSIKDAMACIEGNSEGIALVVDREQRLVRTITDGDIRRAMLAGIDLDGSICDLPAQKPAEYGDVLTAKAGTPDTELLSLMAKHELRHIPLLDDQNCVSDVVLLSHLVLTIEPDLQAIVMAGGYGKRLMPHTEHTPKPMLNVGNRPIIERIISGLRDSGIRKVHISLHYKPEKIVDHLGDGRDFGIDIDYVSESEPLGTAGALHMLKPSQDPILVINGDVLTNLNFRHMLSFHRAHKADLTVAVTEHITKIPYGVVECDGPIVTSIEEKPSIKKFVNAGVYLIEPSVQDMVPIGQRIDMTDLMDKILNSGGRVVGFPITEYWRDIGLPEDFQNAQDDLKSGTLPSRRV